MKAASQDRQRRADELRNLDAEEKRMQEIAAKSAKGKGGDGRAQAKERGPPVGQVVEYAPQPEKTSTAPPPAATQPVTPKGPLDAWFENLDTNTKLYILLFGYVRASACLRGIGAVTAFYALGAVITGALVEAVFPTVFGKVD
eukprot:scaffold5337_cov411-Prasinococcus_capsulatus_cf.AAC.3